MTAFDVGAAVAYNRARFIFTPGLLDWVGRAAGETDPTRTADARDLGEAFARLVLRAQYGGLVLAAGLDGGYGLRVTVETDVAFTLAGEEYTVYQAYGHNAALHVRRGEFIEPRHVLATMGGTGQSGAVRYGEHVDLRTWIDVGPRRVDLSPNVLDRQLPTPAGPPVRRTFPQVATAMLALSLAGTAVLAWRKHARKELR